MQKKFADKFFCKARAVHGDKYDYSKVNYLGCYPKIEILCKKHGSFWTTPQDHLHHKTGCRKCWRESITSSTSEFVKKSKEVHGNQYDYSDTKYTLSHFKCRILIKCKIHGVFQQNPNDHLRGRGCPKCSKRISRLEIEFLDTLNIPEEYRQYPIPNTNYKVDGYDKNTNTVLEFLGDYWHGNPSTKNHNDTISSKAKTTFGKLYQRTIDKFFELHTNGYSVKYIWESEWNNWKKDKSKKLPILEYKK